MSEDGQGNPATQQTILWASLNGPGHEACRAYSQNGNWLLEGTAVFSHNNQACQLSYFIVCDQRWNTLTGKVSGWLDDTSVNIEIVVDAARKWHLNDVEFPAVAGCVDIDLNFSPATNLLPIRRLRLGVGQQAEARAAWLRFPSLTLELLSQRYRRIGESLYRYESGEGKFATDLEVNAFGFITHYPGLWQAEF